MAGIGTGRADGTEVGLAAVDGVVAARAQGLDEGGAHIGTGRAGGEGDAVHVPLGKGDAGSRVVGADVGVQRPVGDAVAGGVHAREEAAARGRADAAGIGLGEHHALLRQLLHVGRMEEVVVGGALGPEGKRGVLPPHVVHQEEDYIGALAPGCGRDGQRGKGKGEEGGELHGQREGAPSVNVHRGCRDFMAFYSCFYCDAITSL